MRLSDAWERHAEEWLAWARTPGHDRWFWRVSLPALLAVLPAPGRLTVDLGCGEGRVGRELLARAHRVIGVESSPTLARAARGAQPPLEVLEADAAAVPLPDGVADLVVLSMVLISLDDPDAVLREAARLLEPGGRVVCSTAHPASTADAAYAQGASYFDTHPFAETRDRGGVRMTFHDVHRPLEAIAGAFEGAGLLIEALREPRPDEAFVADHPDEAVYRDRPAFLVLRAQKP